MCYIISHQEAFWLCYNLGSERLANIPRAGGGLVAEAAYSTGDLDAYDLGRYESMLVPPAWLLEGVTGKSASTAKSAPMSTKPKSAKGTASPNPARPAPKSAPAAESRARHDVLVPDRVGGRSGGRYLRHRWDGDLPEGSLLDLGDGIYASSPELCLLQLAGVLDDVQLVRYAMALCGNYRIGRVRVERHPAITSLARVGELLDDCAGRRGAGRCRRLMRLARDGSRSPKETELHLLLSLPAEMGGYGLGGDELNWQVKFDEEYADILDRPDRRLAYVDLAWPDRMVGAEYQGKDHDDKVPEDRRRINLLTARGLRMFQVDTEQLGDPTRMDATARQVAHALGRRVPEKTEAWLAARGELRETLLGLGHVRL